MKKLLIGIALVALVILGFYALNSYIYEEKQVTAVEDYKDGEYLIDGVRVKLEDGLSEVESTPGSGTKVVTRYFGNLLKTDLNGDGREDVAFLLTQERGGSGTFFYAVAALNTERGYVGSDGYLLGDRIAPQTTTPSPNPRHKYVVVFNYADRYPNEPMTTRPSLGKSAYLKLDTESMQWGVVLPDFEGEADTNRMTLSMKTWNWVGAQYEDGSEIKPKSPNKFTLTFKEDGTFGATTDCNGVGGNYSVSGDKLTFGQMVQTLMFCEGSQESEFVGFLSNTSGYSFTSKGELVLHLKYDSGSVVFK